MTKKEKEEIKKDKLQRLKKIIKEAGYTQEQISYELGISITKINHCLNGKDKFRKEYADKLEEILFLSKEEKEYIFDKSTVELRKRRRKRKKTIKKENNLKRQEKTKTNPDAKIYMLISEEGIEAVARAFIYGIENKDYECLRVGAEVILNAIRGIEIKTKIIEKK